MEKKDTASQMRLVIQALNAAVSSINLAKQLLDEITGTEAHLTGKNEKKDERAAPLPQVPGIIGVFDGQYMVTPDGQKYQVPENYASKSMIVFGDKLKMLDSNGEVRFKQIERVKRQRANGMIVKKEGRYSIVTGDGSYKVLPAAVSYFGGLEGDEARILIPQGNPRVPFAALEGINPKNAPSPETQHTGEIGKKGGKPPKKVKLELKNTTSDSSKKETGGAKVQPKEEVPASDPKNVSGEVGSPEPVPGNDAEQRGKSGTILIGEDELR